jgi:surfactin family lipopeptide synthetase C
VRGYRIEMGEVEEELRKVEGVTEAAVVVRGEGADRRLIGYVVREGKEGVGEEEEEQEIRRELKSRMPDYMVPGRVVKVERMPMLPNGKINRKALLEITSERASNAEIIPPTSPTEKEIFYIWGGLLSESPRSIFDNFFDIGGHSLLATRLISQLKASFAVEISLKDFFAAPTISDLARMVDESILLNSDFDELNDVLEMLDSLDEEDAQRSLAIND